MAATILGLIGVLFGALGAHALEGRFSNESLESYKTGVFYMQWHAGLILVLALTFRSEKETPRFVRWAIRFFFSGILLFTGSILGLVFLPKLGMNARFLGPITPLGGLSFMAGWLCLIRYFLLRIKTQKLNGN